MRARRLWLVIVWAAAAAANAASPPLAAAPSAASRTAARKAAVEPVLEPDEALLARIAALPEGTWMKLPPVTTAGDLSWCGKPGWPNTRAIPRNGPGGRDYCNKMVWAPDRRRALYCGANHGSPHYLNDVWEYDLAANTWVCLSAPDPQYPGELQWPPRTAQKDARIVAWVKANAVLTGGVVHTKRGAPMRPAHTWWGFCYDRDRRRLLWLEPLQGIVFVDRALLAKGLGISAADLKAALRPDPYIWSFDPGRRTWAVIFQDLPRCDQGDAMEYIPDLKRVWLRGRRRGPWLYDPDARAGQDLAAPGPRPRTELVTAYCPESKTIVAVNGTRTYTYAFAANRWDLVQEAAIASGADMRSFFCYDTTAKRFVLFTRPNHLWLYDLARNEWTDPAPKGDRPPSGRGRCVGYYDPERNVTVHYNGREVWVYRCRRAAGRPAG